MISDPMDRKTKQTLLTTARFYDRRKVGDVGALGFRRSTDLQRLLPCLDHLIEKGLLLPQRSLFLDMGAADGRVNVLLSYLVKTSVGIELDEWTLEEFGPLRAMLEEELGQEGLPPPPDNVFLLAGDTMRESLHRTVKEKTGIDFHGFDLFYTYLTMHEEFAELIARKARPGAVFMVYGLEKIQPRLEGLRLLTPERPLEGILSLYQKE